MSIKPAPQQLNWQINHPMAMFIHFGINTYYGREWSDGTLDASAFNPTDLDCRQWVRIAKEAGMAHVILTAKHHDGFCLWPTATKDYSVKTTPWKNGQGDIVRELADACAEADMGLGLYLSPWDRNDKDWEENPAAYDARYIEQLTELCSNYGPLVELWFDGAGSEQHPYDWDAIVGTVRKLQPDALIFNMGEPDIRWVGNEDGLAADPCWYTVGEVKKSIYDDTPLGLEGGDRYCPPECDVAIRRHWFWQEDDKATLKSVQHLMAIWYRSVGLGANLLLNVPPDRRGLIDPADEARLMDFAAELRRRFAHRIPARVEQEGETFTARFSEPVTIDHVVLRENLRNGQHISSHTIALPDGTVIVDGVQTVGSQRVHAFPFVTTDALVITVTGDDASFDSVAAYRTGVESAEDLEQQAEFDSSKLN